jgi:hypothetical protein
MVRKNFPKERLGHHDEGVDIPGMGLAVSGVRWNISALHLQGN